MPHSHAIDWTLDDIRQLLEQEEQENLMLEYKSSMAIGDWTDSKRNELAKDLCAFANSAGGIIVIGIGEEAHKPAIIDDGVDTRLANKEAVESALMARVAPRIDHLTIQEIPNPAHPFHSYFIIGIPRSMRAPHMCTPFHRYYKRYNFECVPMEHYEVEDVRRRQSEPALAFHCALQAAGEPFSDSRRPFVLDFGVLNEGSVTARDVLIRVYVPRWLVGDVNWSPNGSHWITRYNDAEMYRFDVYIRDNAGPIPIYPKDDQPFVVTRGKGRRVTLHLPATHTPELVRAEITAQLFADGMRMRQVAVRVTELLRP